MSDWCTRRLAREDFLKSNYVNWPTGFQITLRVPVESDYFKRSIFRIRIPMNPIRSWLVI